jgi:hypothetical protein
MTADPAQLSLHIARFLHAPADDRRSPVRWRLLPSLAEQTFSDACASLATLPKPIVFAPLTEPGSVYVAPLATLAAGDASAWQWHHKNQVDNFGPFMSALGASDDDVLAFGRDEDVIETRVSVLRQWTQEYLVPLQLTIVKDRTRAGYHWLVVRHGDGRWSSGI